LRGPDWLGPASPASSTSLVSPVSPSSQASPPGQSWVGKLIEASTVSFCEGQRVVTAFCFV